MRRCFFILLLTFFIATTGVFASGTSEKSESEASSGKSIMSLATASMGGSYYIIGSGIAETINKKLSDVQVNAVVAQGSVGNPKIVDSMEAEIGMSNYYAGGKALSGEAPYEKPQDIAGICPLQFSILHFAVAGGNNRINSIADFNKTSIAVGPAGGGGVTIFKSILPYWGLDFDKDIKPSYLSYSESAEALKDHNIEVALIHGAYPVQAISGLVVQDDVKLLNLENDILEDINKDFPFFEPVVIPAGTYKGIDDDTLSLGLRDILIVNKSLPDDLVYRMTKALYEDMENLRKIHPSIKGLSFDGYKDSLVPLHPGAKKFYEELGIPLS